MLQQLWQILYKIELGIYLKLIKNRKKTQRRLNLHFHRRYNQAYEMYVAGYQFLVLNNLFMNHWGLQVVFLSNHFSRGLSIALRDSKITKSNSPDFAKFWSKPSEAVWDRWKTAQIFREKYFRQIFIKNVVLIVEKHEWHYC